jgi:hypothetical protein
MKSTEVACDLGGVDGSAWCGCIGDQQTSINENQRCGHTGLGRAPVVSSDGPAERVFFHIGRLARIERARKVSNPLVERDRSEISRQQIPDVFGLGLLQCLGSSPQGLPLRLRQTDGERGGIHEIYHT